MSDFSQSISALVFHALKDGTSLRALIVVLCIDTLYTC